MNQVRRTRVVSGQSLVHVQPEISHDSKYVFCCCGHVARVFSVASGAPVRDLKGHTDNVTKVALNPTNRCQVYTSSLDNSIILWDFEDGLLLRRFYLDSPTFDFQSSTIDSIYFPNCPSSDLPPFYVLAARRNEEIGYNSRHLHLLKCRIPLLTDHVVTVESIIMGRTNLTEFDLKQERGRLLAADKIDFGCDGTIVAALNPKYTRTMYIYDSAEDTLWKHRNKSDSMVSLACHPRLTTVAAGCKNGKILIFNNVNRPTPARVLFHWHNLPVLSIAFTPDGSHFLSGGHECCIVRWNFETPADRHVIPRLGAAVKQICISRDNDLYVAALSDNSLSVLSTTKEVVQIFQGLVACPFRTELEGIRFFDDREKPLPSLLQSSPVPTGLHVDPKTGCLVLNGRLGHLQFFDLQQQRHLYSLDILDLNYVSPESMKQRLPLTEVKLIAFDEDGDWLATVEQWDSHEFSQHLRMKIWQHDDKSKKFKLNTVLNLPHNKAVTQIAFRGYGDFYGKDEAMLASCGLDTVGPISGQRVDGKFKLWCYDEEEDVYGKSTFWSNDAVETYQNEPAHDLSFSEDGSVLGVAFGRYLTLWVSDSCAFKDAHVNPDSDDKSNIKKIQFGTKDCARFVVYATEKSLLVYDVLTLCVLWFEDLAVTQLVRDPLSSYMAAFENKDSIFVFKPNSKHLTDVVTLKSAPEANILSACFMPRGEQAASAAAASPAWQHRSRLVFLNDKQELSAVLNPADDVEEEAAVEGVGTKMATLDQKTPFGALVAAETTSDVIANIVDSDDVALGRPNRKFVEEVLAMPAHVLPPVSMLCAQFHQMVLKSQGKEDEPKKYQGHELNGEEKQAQTETEKQDEEQSWEDVLARLPDRDFQWLIPTSKEFS